MIEPAEIATALGPWFAARLDGEDVQIADVRRHAEGWSWQTYTMTVEWTSGGEERMKRGFAVRRQPEDGLLAPYDTPRQYRLHQAVRDHSDVPMPDLFWLELDPAVMGMPFYVMERMGGVVPVQWRGNDPEIFPDDETRRSIGLDFVDVLGRIHGLDVEAADLEFLGVPASSDEAAQRQIDWWSDVYEEAKLLEVPLLRACIGWLSDNVATSGRVGLVHGDYRIGNFMLGPDRRINAVFDWELAHLGDPVFDVAWAGMPLFRGRSPLLSQLLAPDEFFARYEVATGFTVDPEVYRFWTVFGHLRASVPHVRATRAFADRRTADLRLAAMGHQNLYILRQLAEELGWGKPAVAHHAAEPESPGSALQVSLERMLEGMATTLADVVAPATEDPFARSQVMAAVELLANLATRVEWRASVQLDAIRRARAVLSLVTDDAPGAVSTVLAEEVPEAIDPAGLTASRRRHYEALGELQSWLDAGGGSEEVRVALIDFVVWDLGEELERLRSGMYRRGSG